MKPQSLVPMLSVASLPRSLEFYGQLGFTVAHSFTPPGSPEPTWVCLESDGAHLMLTKAAEAVVAGQQAVMFYVYCADPEVFRSQLLAAGLQAGTMKYPFYNPRGEFPLVDPDGYELMITHT
ncbi:MAG: VOC family protein [Candidatus Polarisedimenticolia bacterium]